MNRTVPDWNVQVKAEQPSGSADVTIARRLRKLGLRDGVIWTEAG